MLPLSPHSIVLPSINQFGRHQLTYVPALKRSTAPTKIIQYVLALTVLTALSTSLPLSLHLFPSTYISTYYPGSHLLQQIGGDRVVQRSKLPSTRSEAGTRQVYLGWAKLRPDRACSSAPRHLREAKGDSVDGPPGQLL